MRSRLLFLLMVLLGCAKAADGGAPDARVLDDAGDAPDGAVRDAAEAIDAGSDAAESPPFFPCTQAVPVSSGLERCDPSAYLRRVGGATCTSSVPRSAPVEGSFPDLDECTRDSECEHLHLGHCAERDDGNTLVCVPGCETDADCEEGRVCFCGEDYGLPVGRCVPASCDSAADCEPGYECVFSESEPGCPSFRFDCQTPNDSCGSAVDCYGFSPNPTFCAHGDNGFGCSITQCTQP
jgi:hypothetical protein